MSRWTDMIARQETTTQCRSPRRAPVSKFIIHIAEGTFEGTIAWQKGPNQVSSNFITGKSAGQRCQMVDTADEAWTQATANPYCLSSENAGFTGESLTTDQLEANAQYFARAHIDNPATLPLQLMAGPGDSGLGYHSMGGDAWGGHFDCPGQPIINQLPTILNLATLIVDPIKRRKDLNEMIIPIPKALAIHSDGSWLDANAAVPVPVFEVGTSAGQWGNAWVRLLSTGIARVRVVYDGGGWNGTTVDLAFAGDAMVALPPKTHMVYIGRVEGDPLTSDVNAVIRYDR